MLIYIYTVNDIYVPMIWASWKWGHVYIYTYNIQCEWGMLANDTHIYIYTYIYVYIYMMSVVHGSSWDI